MTVKVHKEVQIFKRICSHDIFGDHVEEVHFPQAVCLTGVKLGAVPAKICAEETSFVHIFASDLTTLGAARFACLAEDCALPGSGTKAVRLEATITDHIVLRGKYQTLPVALYGWAHACEDTRQIAQPEGLAFQPNFGFYGSLQKPLGVQPREELSPTAQAAISAALPYFAQVSTSEKAMRNNPLPPELLPSLLAAADSVIGNNQPGSVSSTIENGVSKVDSTAAAELAAGWCRTFAAVPRFGSTAEYGLAGLAAAVILSATPKYATKFLAAGGVPALARVLVTEQPLPRTTRYALAGIEALMLSCPAAASEALLGWWRPTSDRELLENGAEQVPYSNDGQDDEDDADADYYQGEDEPPEYEGNSGGEPRIPQFGDAAGDDDARRDDNREMPATADSDDERPDQSSRGGSRGLRGSKREKKDKKDKRDKRDKDGKRSKRSREPDTREPDTGLLGSEAATPPRSPTHRPRQAPIAHAADTARPVSDRERERRPAERATPRHRPVEADERSRKRSRHESRSRSRSRGRDTRSNREPDERRPASRDERPRERDREERDRRERGDRRDRGDHRSMEEDRSRDPRAGRRRGEELQRERDRKDTRDRGDPAREDRSQDRPAERGRDAPRSRVDERGRGPADTEERPRDRSRRELTPEDRRDRPTAAPQREERRDIRHSRSKERRPPPVDAQGTSGMPRPGPVEQSSRSRSGHKSRSPSRRSAEPEASAAPSPRPRRNRGMEEVNRDSGGRRPRTFKEEAAAERSAAMQEAATFEGCYPAILSSLLQLLPGKVASMGKRIISRLQVYEAAARFQVAAEDAMRGHAEGTETPLRQVHMACSQAGAALAGLAHALLSCPAIAAATKPPVVEAFNPSGLQLPEPFDLDPWALEALAARRCLAILPALLHVPALQALSQQASGVYGPGQSTIQIQTQLAQPIVGGLGQLLSLLTSCTAGLMLLNSNLSIATAIMEALESGASQVPFAGQPSQQSASRPASAEVAQNLKATLAASQAFQVLKACIPSTPALAVKTGALVETDSVASAVQHLLEAVSTEAGKRSVVAALTCTPNAVEFLLRIVKEPIAKNVSAGLEGEGREAATWRPDSIHAVRLLAVAVGNGHIDVLGHLAPHAASIKDTVTATLNVPEVQQPGGDKAKRDLKAVRGRVDMMLLLAENGPTEVLASMSTHLPPLVTPDGQKKGVKEVECKACAALLHNTEKAASVETGLHILHSLLKAPLGPHASVIIANANGLETLERAVRCGSEVLAASEADSEWVSLAGDALDNAEVLANRSRAASFLASSLLAISTFLQRLRERGSELNSASLMRVLLLAHAQLTVTPESLAALGGHMTSQPRHPILQGRQAAAAALKCWLDAETWTPDLVTAIFTSGKPLTADGPEVIAMSPGEMVRASSLLGDLFPSEWPPSGSSRRIGGSHPPPSHMAFRRAIATSFEMRAAVFRQLVVTAAASNSRIFRAMLVRLCARASGLGGGMGVFLANPLMEELQACASDPGACTASRRVLEILVPLVYRPAMKAAFLELGIAGSLSKLLLSLVIGKAEPSELTALCTMALEVVTVLFNPDVCLKPLSPAPQRIHDECPTLQEAASLVAVLLSTLTSMAGNAHISKRIIASLGAHAHGRASLRLGATTWQAQATGGAVQDLGPKVALQWAVSRLWQLGQAEGNEAGMRGICMEVAGLLEEVATSSDDHEDEPPQRAPLGQRFAAAVQASVSAAEALGMAVEEDPSKGELAESSSPEALIHDAAARMFWRNVKARSTGQVVGTAPKQMGVAADSQAEPPVLRLGKGLTKAKRPRDLVPGTLTGISVAMADAKKLIAEEAGNKPAAAAAGATSDLPPVLAGPGRPKGRPFGRTGSTSGRPASMHVDDFEKAASSGGGPPPGAPPARPVPSAVPPPRPPPGGPKPPPPKGTPPSDGSMPKYPSKPIRPFGAPKPPSNPPGTSPGAPSPSALAGSPSDARNVAELMKSPAAVAELLKDPVRLQQLLEQNPALMSVLKARMQGL